MDMERLSVGGGFMFFMMGVLFPLAEKQLLSFSKLSLSFLIWLVAGLLYGYVLKLSSGMPFRKKLQHKQEEERRRAMRGL